MPPATLNMPEDRPPGWVCRHPQRARLLSFVRGNAVDLEDRLTVLRVVECGGADPAT